MRNLKRTLIFFVLMAVLAGMAAGAALTIQTIHEYNGACSKLTGFPGLLQQTGLLQSGTCTTHPGGALCNKGASCTVSGKPGTCKNTGKPGGAAVCTCVANPSV